MVNPSAMMPAVTILDLHVCFGVRNDCKMLSTILRCFPNIDTLHIHVSQRLIISFGFDLHQNLLAQVMYQIFPAVFDWFN